jgi:putative ABC transport system substrate-binding protein
MVTTLIILVAGLLLLAPFAREAHAQAPIARIGVLVGNSPATSATWLDAFRQRLSELGHVEGRNIAIEVRYGLAQPERLQDIASEFVKARMDVIVVEGTQGTRAAKEKTSTIQIVMAYVGDAVGRGFVKTCRGPAATSRGSRSWDLKRPSRVLTCSWKPSLGPSVSRCSTAQGSRRTPWVPRG